MDNIDRLVPVASSNVLACVIALSIRIPRQTKKVITLRKKIFSAGLMS